MNWLIQYIFNLKLNKLILWCYLIWYLVTIYFYFDPNPKIWINSLGISAVIGTALVLSVLSNISDIDYWQLFRLYLMPFCVSSFSSSIKDKGFIVVLSPNFQENLIAIICCTILFLIVSICKLTNRKIEC